MHYHGVNSFGGKDKMKNIGLLVLVFTTTLIVNNHLSFAQSPVAIWIKVSDNLSPPDSATMWFGNHKDATYEKADTLYVPEINPWGTLREDCSCPPDACDILWKSIPGRVNTWGLGLLVYDFRPFPMNETRKDTFKLGFGGWSSDDLADYTFHWPNREYLASVCDSIKCTYDYVTLINMFDIDSLVIPDAGNNGIVSLRIYKWGKVSTGVTPTNPEIPREFKLDSNYPNPFNPITTFSYAVPHLSHVTITVTNVLGQHVATVVDKEYPAGDYTQTWDATNLSSGIYFYKMQVDGKFSETKKLVLLR
jgi:hypothetical protein